MEDKMTDTKHCAIDGCAEENVYITYMPNNNHTVLLCDNHRLLIFGRPYDRCNECGRSDVYWTEQERLGQTNTLLKIIAMMLLSRGGTVRPAEMTELENRVRELLKWEDNDST